MLLIETKDEVQIHSPYRDAVWEDAYMTNLWHEQLVHLLQLPDWIDEAVETLSVHDVQGALRILCYAVTCLRGELVAWSTEASAAYHAKYGEAHAAWQAALKAKEKTA